MSGEKRTLGAAIFADIEDNEYLNKIHEKVLYNYALRLLQLTKKEPLPFDQKEKRDALRFADLLSKSNDPEKANAHKIWAQEIVILLNELHPEDTLIKLYAGDVFSSIGNHKGIEHINSNIRTLLRWRGSSLNLGMTILRFPPNRARSFSLLRKRHMTT